MSLLSVGNTVAWGLAALISAYVAQRKGKNAKLALLLGILFGIFSMVYYLFCKSKRGGWKRKKSWFILVGYTLFVILLVLIEFLLGII
jgi:hypothetical protein